jgi:hypothetical protein
LYFADLELLVEGTRLREGKGGLIDGCRELTRRLEFRLDETSRKLAVEYEERGFRKLKWMTKALRVGGCCLHGPPKRYCKTCRKLQLPDGCRGEYYEETPGLDVAEYWYRRSGRKSIKMDVALDRINAQLNTLHQAHKRLAEKFERRIAAMEK